MDQLDERMIEEQYIQIAPSRIPNGGNGAFAKQSIPSGTIIGTYRGKNISEEEYSKKGFGPYALRLQTPDGSILIDGEKEGNWVTRINDPRGTSHSVNVVFEPDGRVKTTQQIEQGEELFVSYGEAYWETHDKVEKEKTLFYKKIYISIVILAVVGVILMNYTKELKQLCKRFWSQARKTR
jgi:hypothetical protein